MIIGIPKEIKDEEHRVGLTPASVRAAVDHGHRVLVEADAATAIGFGDGDYVAAGAEVVPQADEIFATAEMIVKVKELQPAELPGLRDGQVIFTYLHLAPDPEQARGLIDSGAVAIAYETVTDRQGGLPLLAPMSEVAGRMSVQAGAHCLEMEAGGRGVLLGRVPGVEPGRVLVLGGGVVGAEAARTATGIGAQVTIVDRSIDRLRYLDSVFGSLLTTIYSTKEAIEEQAITADLVIGAALVRGAAAPKLVSRELVASMPRGSVLVDVAIDQGGCFATSRPTTHSEPSFVVDEVVHYCVTNMPGAVARTSTLALNNATLPFVLAIADRGYRQAMADDPCLREGLNIHRGDVTHPAVAEALGLEHVAAERALGIEETVGGGPAGG